MKERNSENREIDLCPDCTAQLLSWIKNEAEFFERKDK